MLVLHVFFLIILGIVILSELWTNFYLLLRFAQRRLDFIHNLLQVKAEFKCKVKLRIVIFVIIFFGSLATRRAGLSHLS